MTDSHDIAGVGAPPDAARATAEAFGSALDAGDLAAAARRLAPDCVCRDGALTASGADAVIALYRAAVHWAERGFDDVRHASAVERASEGAVRLVVTTMLMRVPGRWHRLRHARDLVVGADGRISRIVNSCERGAAEAFRAFVSECKVPPPPPGFGI